MAGVFTAREYGAALVGTLLLTWFARGVKASDARRAVLLEDRLLQFQAHYEEVAKPFEWRFTRRDLQDLLRKLSSQPKAA